MSALKQNISFAIRTLFQMVTPEYVETLGIRMVNGRSINEHDTPNSMRVVTVNEYFVKRYLAGADPLTQRISFPEIIPECAAREAARMADRRRVSQPARRLDVREDNPEINVPFAQSPWPQASMVDQDERRSEGSDQECHGGS